MMTVLRYRLLLLCIIGSAMTFTLDAQNKQNDTTQRADKVYTVVEQMPQFPGGEKKLLEFIAMHLKYPPSGMESCVHSSVIVRFVITKTGKVKNCEVIRPLDPTFDKEALRVVRLLPRWIPGKQYGKKVAVYYTLPVRFRLYE